MARNSNKQSRLARRKVELEHAIRHELGEDVIHRRADKVRDAALTMLKKYRPPFLGYADGDEMEQWKELEERWRSISTEEVISKAAEWGEAPAVRDLRFR